MIEMILTIIGLGALILLAWLIDKKDTTFIDLEYGDDEEL